MKGEIHLMRLNLRRRSLMKSGDFLRSLLAEKSPKSAESEFFGFFLDAWT